MRIRAFVLSPVVVMCLCVLFAPGACGGGGGSGVVNVMPFGDSLTTCCHVCAVAPEALPPDVRAGRSEAKGSHEGYMRPLWHRLRAEFSDDVTFDFVGRTTDCLLAKPKGPRVNTSDWPVRYEGHCGQTTAQIAQKRVAEGAMRHAVQRTGRASDVVLLHLGTNDLVFRVDGNTTTDSLAAVLTTLAAGGDCGGGRRRAIVVALPLPIDFGYVHVPGIPTPPTMALRRARNTAAHQRLHTAIVDALARVAGPRVASAPLPRVPLSQPAVDMSGAGRNPVGERAAAPNWPVLGQWKAVECPAPASSSSGTDVLLVDMYGGVSTDDALRIDGVHPARAGELVMADRFFVAIRHWLRSRLPTVSPPPQNEVHRRTPPAAEEAEVEGPLRSALLPLAGGAVAMGVAAARWLRRLTLWA